MTGHIRLQARFLVLGFQELHFGTRQEAAGFYMASVHQKQSGYGCAPIFGGCFDIRTL